MRVILGTGNGEHFWASLCWSIFLLRPLSEDVVLDMVDIGMEMDHLADLSRTFGLVLYLSLFLDGKKQQQCWW